MKFDKRISSDLRDVYTLYCRNNDNLLGIEVYASNDIDDFNNIDRCRKGKVEFIDAVHGYAVKIDSENTCYFNFVIPAMCVKEKKKEFRPFVNTKEFFLMRNFKVGDLIHIRSKANNQEYQLLITGCTDNKLMLGSFYSRSFNELLQDFELWNSEDNKFIPFGVEE